MDSCRNYPPPAAANWVNRIGFLPGQFTHQQIQEQDNSGTQVKHRLNHPFRTGFLILKRLSWYSTPTATVRWNIKQNLPSKLTILHVLRHVTHKHHVSGTLRKSPPFFWNIPPRHWMTMSDVSGQRYGTIFKCRISNKELKITLFVRLIGSYCKRNYIIRYFQCASVANNKPYILLVEE
jgi:hypothetical protein